MTNLPSDDSGDAKADRPKVSADEGELLWDEFKYRHDLIWRHLIRSTGALVILVTLGFSADLRASKPLVVLAAGAAVAYWLATVWTIEHELRLFQEVARLHCRRQAKVLRAKWILTGTRTKRSKLAAAWGYPFRADPFGKRVCGYLILLFVTTIAAAAVAIRFA